MLKFFLVFEAVCASGLLLIIANEWRMRVKQDQTRVESPTKADAAPAVSDKLAA